MVEMEERIRSWAESALVTLITAVVGAVIGFAIGAIFAFVGTFFLRNSEKPFRPFQFLEGLFFKLFKPLEKLLTRLHW